MLLHIGVCARELISITEKKLRKFQSYKGTSSSNLHPLAQAKGSTAITTGGEGKVTSQNTMRRLTPTQVEEYREKTYVLNVMNPTHLDISAEIEVSCSLKGRNLMGKWKQERRESC